MEKKPSFPPTTKPARTLPLEVLRDSPPPHTGYGGLSQLPSKGFFGDTLFDACFSLFSSGMALMTERNGNQTEGRKDSCCLLRSFPRASLSVCPSGCGYLFLVASPPLGEVSEVSKTQDRPAPKWDVFFFLCCRNFLSLDLTGCSFLRRRPTHNQGFCLFSPAIDLYLLLRAHVAKKR